MYLNGKTLLKAVDSPSFILRFLATQKGFFNRTGKPKVPIQYIFKKQWGQCTYILDNQTTKH